MLEGMLEDWSQTLENLVKTRKGEGVTHVTHALDLQSMGSLPAWIPV